MTNDEWQRKVEQSMVRLERDMEHLTKNMDTMSQSITVIADSMIRLQTQDLRIDRLEKSVEKLVSRFDEMDKEQVRDSMFRIGASKIAWVIITGVAAVIFSVIQITT